MTILQQVLLAFAAFVLFIFAIRLVFALLLRLQLLPILVWLGRRPPLPPMGGGTSICVLRCPGTFRVAGAVLLAPPGGGVGTGTANAAAGRATDQR